MGAKKTKGRGGEEKTKAFSFAPMGHGISGMMTKCCQGREGFQDCGAARDGMMKQMKKQNCTPDKDAAALRREK